MNILDTNGLLPTPALLMDVITHHPLLPRLTLVLDAIEVVVSECCDIPIEQITTDLPNRKAILGLGRASQYKSNFECILFHELSHVADRANPAFMYSDQLKDALPKPVQFAVMELWNLYIDARLNAVGRFDLGYDPVCITLTHGRLPAGVEGKLMCHAVMMENQGILYDKAIVLVRSCWESPPQAWSYPEMIKWVKTNTGER